MSIIRYCHNHETYGGLFVQAELASKQATIEKQRNNVKNAQDMVRSLNPDNLRTGEWRAGMNQKLERLKVLEQSHPEVEQVRQRKCNHASGHSYPICNTNT